MAAMALMACGSQVTVAGGGEPGGAPAVAPEPEPGFACSVSDEERPMLAARVNHDIVLAYRDGSTQVAFSYDVPDGAGLMESHLIARGDFVAGRAVVNPFPSNDSFEPRAEMVVLSVDGEVVFHDVRLFPYDGGSDSQLVGRTDGLFVSTLHELDTGDGVVVSGSEVVGFVAPWIALSDPDPAGRFVTRHYGGNSTADLWFFDVQTLQATPSLYLEDDDRASSPAMVPGGFAYLDRNPSRLLYESPEGTSTTPIDLALPVDFGHASPTNHPDGDWTLWELHGGEPRVVVARPRAGEWREVALVAPEGWTVPESTNRPAIDREGRILEVLERGAEKQLHRTKDGITWEALGSPVVPDGYSHRLLLAGSAVVFDGHGFPGQLIGPQGGEGIELVRWEPDGPSNPIYADDVLSGDGACLAYFRGGTIHVMETATYDDRDLAVLAETQGAEMAFVPLAVEAP